MNQKKLTEALDHVVEDCVNRVGVDLNTASASLLEYVSGVSKAIAKNIVIYREENGKFASRSQLLKVAKLGPKAYEQCAGFLRISDGKIRWMPPAFTRNPMQRPRSFSNRLAILSPMSPAAM